MIEVLKEMGTVCQNKRLGELLKDFHRRKFEEVRYWDRQKGRNHQEQFMFWTEKVVLIPAAVWSSDCIKTYYMNRSREKTTSSVFMKAKTNKKK